MQFFAKFIDFSRQHYEKIALSLALLLLGGAVLWLNNESRNAQEQIEEYLRNTEARKPILVKPANLTNLNNSIEAGQKPAPVDLSSPHNLFNPVKWLKQPDGTYIKNIKGTEATLDQLQVTRINPLLMTIALDRYTGTGYMITITNEAAIYPSPRRIPGFYTLNDTNKPIFAVREIRGPQDNPTELILEMKDTGEKIAISKDRMDVRTNAFEVDLKYLGNKSFNKQRINSVINLSGEDYKIVAITPNDVVFSATNDKKYTVPLRQNPQR